MNLLNKIKLALFTAYLSRQLRKKKVSLGVKELPRLSMIYKKKKKTFVIMPAMAVGTSFVEFSKTYSDRYIDVGIAEEHATSMAAMMAHQGIKVFLPLYATFSQRAFDQILNDIARSDHHVVFGIDRAGVVGEDGSTHQGIFDVSMFSLMPHVVVAMPYDLKRSESII